MLCYRLGSLVLGTVLALATAPPSLARDDSERILAVDHLVPHVSTAPAVSGETVQLYVRERVLAADASTDPSPSGRVGLFVHGSTTPSEVGFDAQYQDYSWMAYLAQAGFDVFGLDLTGFGPSARPAPMDDPCDLAPASQALLVPSMLPATCPSTYDGDLITIASDQGDLDAVIDYVRSLRHVNTRGRASKPTGTTRSVVRINTIQRFEMPSGNSSWQQTRRVRAGHPAATAHLSAEMGRSLSAGARPRLASPYPHC
jgi:hypothetical protein